MTTLTSKDKATLRGVAQTLKPAVRVGRDGLQTGAIAEIHSAFRRGELVKVAFNAERSEIAALCAEVEQLTGSQCVGGVGKRRSFYREAEASASLG